MTRHVIWIVVGGVVLIGIISGALFVTHINSTAERDTPLAEADCARDADGGEYDLTWDFDLSPGWTCSWASDQETGGSYIPWNFYSTR